MNNSHINMIINRLESLSHPQAEAMPEKLRMDQLIHWGMEAAEELKLLQSLLQKLMDQTEQTQDDIEEVLYRTYRPPISI